MTSRWLEEGAPPKVAELLESTVVDEPSGEQLARLHARVAPLFVTPPAPPATPAGGLASASVKVLAGAVIALGVGGVILSRRPAPPPAPPREAATTSAPVQGLVIPPAPVEPGVDAGPPAAAPTRPRPLAPAQRKPAPPEGPPAAAPEGELALLRRAMHAEPETSLTLVAEHEARFPDSALAQEREVVAIEALAKLRRLDEARARAERFRARWPTSMHLSRLESLVR